LPAPGAAGIYYLARVPLHGSYVTDLLPGFLVMSLGLGLVFVSITAAVNVGVPGDKAGLAAGLLNASQQVGSALGLAILSVLAITRTNDLIAEAPPQPAPSETRSSRTPAGCR
jgi:putative Ca2+/H+ antiporter (TMEM165/GDT1 family)